MVHDLRLSVRDQVVSVKHWHLLLVLTYSEARREDCLFSDIVLLGLMR